MDSIEILVSIRKIVRSLNLESKSIQKDFGLSIPQLLCMHHLEKSPKHQSNHQTLMDVLCLNSSTVTGIINRLEKRGYVIRLRETDDRRITKLQLTNSGINLLKETPNILHDRLADKLDALNIEERRKVQNALEIIISAMEIKKVDAAPVLTTGEHID